MKIIGDFFDIKLTKSLNDLVNNCYMDAINSFKKFVSMIGLDPSLFEHLYHLKIVINNKADVDESQLSSFLRFDDSDNDVEIHIAGRMINMVQLRSNNRDSLTHCILKEMLRCNRCIMIKDKFHPNKDDMFLRSSTPYHRISMKYKYDKKDSKIYTYNSAIDNSANDFFINFDNKLSYLLENDKDATKKRQFIVSYKLDHDLGEFAMIYDNTTNLFGSYLITDDMSIYSLRDKITAEDILKNVEVTDYFNINNEYNNALMCCDYDIDSNHNSIEYLKQKTYFNHLYYLADEIENQFYFEDCLTKVFALIIDYISSTKMKELNLDYICDYYLPNYYDQNVTFMSRLIMYGGVDFCKWYLLSCYEDEYDNKISKILGDDYDRVMEIFGIISEGRIAENYYISDYPSLEKLKNENLEIIKRRLTKN